jgi:HK97 gp10 family phage protein
MFERAKAGQFMTVREANAALRSLPDWAKREVQAVMDGTASAIAIKATRNAARNTGLLQRSITWKRRSGKRSIGAVVGVEKDAYYWRFLEYGTVKMEKRPFIRPAAMSEEDRHQRELIAALQRAANLMTTKPSATSRLL